VLPEFKSLIDREAIAKRVAELGREITRDYQGKELLCVGILKGSVPFLSALIQEIRLPLELDFVCVSSYGNRTQNSGTVKLSFDLLRPIKGRDVLLVEDVVDTGITLQHLLALLNHRGPASLKIASLLLKPGKLHTDIKVDYLGFEIGDEFVIGYGLDYAEKYRNLPYVAVLPPAMIRPE
jgi:hypoxanthine phosphoribosyltransferase